MICMIKFRSTLVELDELDNWENYLYFFLYYCQ